MSRQEQPWLRLYTNVLDSHKAQSLPAETFRGWINLLALYKRHGETMPDATQIAFALRINQRAASKLVSDLLEVGLLDEAGGVISPHNWDDRQFRSDNASLRVQAYRERHKPVTSNVPCNVTSTVTRNVAVTPDGTAQETDTEQNRTERVRAPAPQPLPVWLPPDVWSDFVAHRKALKAKLTPHAANLIVRKLDELRAKGHDPAAILNRSIENGWKGVFEPHEPKHVNGSAAHVDPRDSYPTLPMTPEPEDA